MRVILDTNIYISGLISKPFRNKLNQIFDDFTIQLLIDRVLFEEIEDVVKRPKITRYVVESDIVDYLAFISKRCEWNQVNSIVNISPDPDDDFLLALAKDGQADFLITGNKRDLLDLKEFEDTIITTLNDFLLHLSDMDSL